MDVEQSARPIFSDATGRRARALRWLAFGLTTCFALTASAIVLALATHVSVPHLDALVGPEPRERPPATAPSPAAEGDRAFDAARRSLPRPPTPAAAPARPTVGDIPSLAEVSRPIASAPRPAVSHRAPRKADGGTHDATRRRIHARPHPQVKAAHAPTRSRPGHEPPAKPQQTGKPDGPRHSTGQHRGRGHTKPHHNKPHQTGKDRKPHKATGHQRGRGHAKPHQTGKHQTGKHQTGKHQTGKHRKPHRATGQHGRGHKSKSTHKRRSK